MKIKNFNKVSLRRLMTLFIVFVFTITLSSCRNTYNRFPNGDIEVGKEYARIGDVVLSEGELWDEFRYSTNGLLKEKFESVLIETYVEKIKDVLNGTDSETKTDYLERLDKYASKGVFGTDDLEAAEDLLRTERVTQAKTFEANLQMNDLTYIEYLNSKETSKLIDINALVDLDFTKVHEYFYQDLAKYLFAQDKLEKDIKEHDEDLDDDEDPYFSNSEIKAHFKSEYVNSGDIKLLLIRFMNENEVNETLKSFGIKVFKNAWYFVPGEGKTFLQYGKYYDKLEINTSGSITDEYIPFSAYDEATVAEIFIEIYNYIYTYRDPLPTVTQITADTTTTDRRAVTQQILDQYQNNPELSEIITTLGDNEYVNYTAEEVNDINSSLKSYVYETLIVPGDDSDPDKTTFFSPTGRSYGNFYYLVYKLDVEEDEYTDVYTEDEDNEEFIDPALHPELVAKIIAELKENELTESFVTNAITEAKNEMRVQIYDTILEIAYSLENADYSRTIKKPKDNNTLAKITYDSTDYFFTVNEAFNELEKTIGSSTAVDLLSKKIIKDTEFYKNIDAEDEKLYKDNLDYTLAMFTNDQLTSYGYPASMGKYNFMLMYYKSTNVNQIVENFYKVNAAMSNYIYNYENGLLLEQFVNFTNQAVDKHMTISASNLLVYVDMDEDGNPDRDYNWAELQDDAKQLIDNIMNYVKAFNKDHLTALQEIVEDYNASSRFTNGLCRPVLVGEEWEYDPTRPDCKWAEFRKLGLYVKIDTYDNITNVSNNTEIPTILRDRLFEIYSNEPGDFVYSEDLLNYPYIDHPDDTIQTMNGFNQLIITSASLPAKFTFDEDNDLAKYYTDIPVVFNENHLVIEDLFSDGDRVSVNQIKLFIYENQTFNSTKLLPPDIVSALTTFFQPVLQRYTSSATQRELLLRYVQSSGDEITFASQINQDRFELVRVVSKDLEDNFAADDISNTFVGWWTDIFVPGGNA